MERMTETIGFKNEKPIGRVKDGNLSKSKSYDIMQRLTAYEDTGLTLEEVADLVRAKAEGRLVVLPCRLDSRVYAITRCERIQMHHDNDYVNGTGAIDCPFESQCVHEDCSDDNVMIVETQISAYLFEYDQEIALLEDLANDYTFNDFGKTVFLTREDAEKALGVRE